MGFTRFSKSVLNVSALPNRVQNQASALKATFDQAGVDIKAAFNALLTELESSSSAGNIGADVSSVTTKTVQAILTAFEVAIANRYTKVETDALLLGGTNSLVADVDVNLTTGVITVTKKDGTVESFDTALEKVPAKFEVVENGDTFALKITNVDGTTTQADITQFMNVYDFTNSDEVAIEVVGTGNEKTVTASIRANSIGLDKLSLSAISTLEGYVASAADSASAAATSESNAKASELSAAESKSTAVTKADEASASASNAAESAATATSKAEEASANATSAENSASIAVTKANEASESATSAENSASIAVTKANEASTSATNAANSANTAISKASEASASATSAGNSANIATSKADEANASATSASDSANTATSKASEASANATEAESWAVGGTGSRTGEDTNNAKYWAEQARDASQGGDMLKSVYDTDGDGVVDDAEKFGGQLPEYYAKAADLSGKANSSHTHTANQVTSGTFPSGVSCNTPTANAHLANKAYVDSKAGSVQFKTGSYTNDDTRYNKTIIIDVGFTPDIVILYTEGNNDQYVATEANTTARFNHVPKILTAAFTNTTDSYGRIKENGFSSYIDAGASLYYIAIKF